GSEPSHRLQLDADRLGTDSPRGERMAELVDQYRYEHHAEPGHDAARGGVSRESQRQNDEEEHRVDPNRKPEHAEVEPACSLSRLGKHRGRVPPTSPRSTRGQPSSV